MRGHCPDCCFGARSCTKDFVPQVCFSTPVLGCSTSSTVCHNALTGLLYLDIKSLALCRHDFVVVETIEFEDDEDDELPMLLTQRDVVHMNKAGPQEEE